VIPSREEGSLTIQFESLEPIIVPLAAQISMKEMSLASDDGEGWIVVTQQNPRKPKHAQAPPLHHTKR